MILAAQCALNFHFVVHQFHAAVTANIVEHLDLVLLVAQDYQRQPHEFNRFDIAFLRQVAGEPEPCPTLAQDLVTFLCEKLVAGVGLVG